MGRSWQPCQALLGGQPLVDFARCNSDFFSSARVIVWLPLLEGLLFCAKFGPPDEAMVFSSFSSCKVVQT